MAQPWLSGQLPSIKGKVCSGCYSSEDPGEILVEKKDIPLSLQSKEGRQQEMKAETSGLIVLLVNCRLK